MGIKEFISSFFKRPVEENKLEKEVKLYSVSEIPEEKPRDIYMPQEERKRDFLDRVKNYWAESKPKSAFDYSKYLAKTNPALSGPIQIYELWKLPIDAHEDLNYILSRAYELSAVHPEARLATGVAYAISQTIYGIKTKSGKHILSGLQGIVTHFDKNGISALPIKEQSGAKSLAKKANSLIEKLGN